MLCVSNLFSYSQLYLRKELIIEFMDATLKDDIGTFKKGQKFLVARLHIPTLTIHFYETKEVPTMPSFSVCLEVTRYAT